MSEPHSNKGLSASAVNGLNSPNLEVRLRHYLGEQHRLHELLDKTRADLDRASAALMAFQDEYCTDAAREEEYLCCLEQILGFDPRVDPKEIEEMMKNPQGIE